MRFPDTMKPAGTGRIADTAKAVGAAALAVALTATPLIAEQPEPAAAPEATGGAAVEFARVALYYGALTGEVIRSTGVANFSHVATGIYCIKADINVKKAVPTVSVERLQSPSGAGLLAYWRWSTANCPNAKRWIEVNTYRFSAGVYPILTDDVSYTLTVP
jgi:hypothetical protein